jgi:hypothetical protein
VTREITARTWLVECYAPGLATATVTGDGERLRAAIEVVRPDAGPVDYLGALVVAGDEAVFYAFRADDPASVEAVSRRAGLRFARIVESVGVAAPGLVDALSGLLDQVASRPTADGPGGAAA